MRSIGFPELQVILGAVGIVGLILIVALAFLPSIVGWGKRDRLGIVVLNFVAFPLVGLIYLGVPTWIVALIWAFRSEKREYAPVVLGPPTMGLNLSGNSWPQSPEPNTIPYPYSVPHRRSGLPVWLMTVLIAFMLIGLMYLGSGFLGDSSRSATSNLTPMTKRHPRRP